MSITYDDLAKIGQEMQEQKDQWYGELFSCFKGADYVRGDKIVIGQLVAEKFEIPSWAKDRITASSYVPVDSYLVLFGDKKEERVGWAFEDHHLQILKNPAGIINTNCMA